jgi:hypothetical protein
VEDFLQVAEQVKKNIAEGNNEPLSIMNFGFANCEWTKL